MARSRTARGFCEPHPIQLPLFAQPFPQPSAPLGAQTLVPQAASGTGSHQEAQPVASVGGPTRGNPRCSPRGDAMQGTTVDPLRHAQYLARTIREQRFDPSARSATVRALCADLVASLSATR